MIVKQEEMLLSTGIVKGLGGSCEESVSARLNCARLPRYRHSVEPVLHLAESRLIH